MLRRAGGRRVEALPKACPHCGFPVPDVGTTSLFCTECSSAFLNIPQHLLMLGASVTPRRKPAAKAAPAAAALSPPGPHPDGAARPARSGTSAGKSAEESMLRGTVVGREQVLQVVSAQAGIPLGQLRGDPRWFAELRRGLQAAVLGQEAAVGYAPHALQHACRSLASHDAVVVAFSTDLTACILMC